MQVNVQRLYSLSPRRQPYSSFGSGSRIPGVDFDHGLDLSETLVSAINDPGSTLCPERLWNDPRP